MNGTAAGNSTYRSLSPTDFSEISGITNDETENLSANSDLLRRALPELYYDSQRILGFVTRSVTNREELESLRADLQQPKIAKVKDFYCILSDHIMQKKKDSYHPAAHIPIQNCSSRPLHQTFQSIPFPA